MGKVRKSSARRVKWEGKWQLGVSFNELEKVKGRKVIFNVEEESLSVKGGFIMCFLLPLLYFFIHYSIILSAGATGSPRTFHHVSPAISRKSLWNLSPPPPHKSRARPLRSQCTLVSWLMDGQVVPCDAGCQALDSSSAQLSPFCLQTLMIHTYLLLCIRENALHPRQLLQYAHFLHTLTLTACSACQLSMF